MLVSFATTKKIVFGTLGLGIATGLPVLAVGGCSLAWLALDFAVFRPQRDRTAYIVLREEYDGWQQPDLSIAAWDICYTDLAAAKAACESSVRSIYDDLCDGPAPLDFSWLESDSSTRWMLDDSHTGTVHHIVMAKYAK